MTSSLPTTSTRSSFVSVADTLDVAHQSIDAANSRTKTHSVGLHHMLHPFQDTTSGVSQSNADYSSESESRSPLLSLACKYYIV